MEKTTYLGNIQINIYDCLYLLTTKLMASYRPLVSSRINMVYMMTELIT